MRGGARLEILDQKGATMIVMVAIFMVVGAIIYAAMQSTETNLQKSVFAALNGSVNSREAENFTTLIAVEMQNDYLSSTPPPSRFLGSKTCKPQSTNSLLPALPANAFYTVNIGPSPAFRIFCNERAPLAGPPLQQNRYDLLVQKLDPSSTAQPLSELYFHLVLSSFPTAPLPQEYSP
jgi:hypothetical protein